MYYNSLYVPLVRSTERVIKMYIVIAAVLGTIGGAALMGFVLAGPVPFIDRGSRIFTVPNEEDLNSVVQVLAKLGLKPRFRIFSKSIKRAVMADNTTIINCTTDLSLWEKMGKPAAGLALKVRNPQKSANEAASLLRRQGFEAENLGQLDPDVPRGAMFFVRTDAFNGTILVFRKHFLKMGPKPPHWT
jgi:hypothetical protein